jgi:hypothetical protein
MSEKYNVASLKDAKPGQTQETGGQGEAGLYEHPEAKNPDGSPKQIITTYDPLFGNAQSNGVIRLGFKRVGDAPEGSIKTLPELAQDTKAAEADSLKGITARLTQLESVSDDNKKLQAQVDALLKEKADREKADAEAAGSSDREATDTAAAVERFNAGEKLNSTDLKLVAKAEGVELTPELDSNKKVADAIYAKREKEGK